jgi:Fur family ferric uptake transcriptional regulator
MVPKKSGQTPLPCGRPAAPTHHDQSGDAPALKISEWQERLRVYLTKEGLKYTEQRWKIAELILDAGGHLDAQQIVDRVKERYPDIGAATVYRNLKVLCDAMVLNECLVDPHGRVIYEMYDEGHHDHIVCVDCGEIFEFHSDKIESLQNAILSEMRFSQVRHRHVIYSQCRFKARS